MALARYSTPVSENLDLVRSIFADWERGDFSGVDWADPEVAFVIPDGLQPGIWMGVTSMVERWHEGEAAWEDQRVEADEYASSTTGACSCSSIAADGAR